MWLGEWGVLVSGPGSTWSFEAYEEVPGSWRLRDGGDSVFGMRV